MELVGHDFFLFIDAETDRPESVYRRRGVEHGVIKPLHRRGRGGHRPAEGGALAGGRPLPTFNSRLWGRPSWFNSHGGAAFCLKQSSKRPRPA